MVIYICFKCDLMRVFYGFFALLTILTACQPATPGQQAGVQDSTRTTTPKPAPAVYYKRLKGTVASQPVTMHLIKRGPAAFEGWYAYDKQGIPIQLFHNTEDTVQLSFSEWGTPEGGDNTFKGTLTDDGAYKGTWSGNNKTFDFDLKEELTGAVLFDVFTISDSALLFPANPKSPLGVASSTAVWPVGGADEAALAAVRKALTPKDVPEDPEQIVRQPVASFLHEYNATHDEVDTNDLKKGAGASWNWDAQHSVRIVWNAYPLVAFEISDYAYTGGAHGNHGSSFTVVDLARKKQLGLDDVFKPGYKAVLGTALENSFRKKYNVPAGEPLDKQYLFDKHIAPNDNFFVTDKGVVFCYTPYEIAAYALGQITLFVPFGDVKTHVNEAYLTK